MPRRVKQVSTTSLVDLIEHYVSLRFRYWKSSYGGEKPHQVFDNQPDESIKKWTFASEEEAEECLKKQRQKLRDQLKKDLDVQNPNNNVDQG